MSESAAILALIGILVTAVVAPAVTLFLNRNKDGTALAQNALTVANQAVTDLAKANLEIHSLKGEINKLKRQRTGPYRIQLDAYIDPLNISNATITLVESTE